MTCKASTGFNVKIREKEHYFFLDLATSAACSANRLVDVPETLLRGGNCIPCAMWHLLPERREAIVDYLGQGTRSANILATRRGYRTPCIWVM